MPDASLIGMPPDSTGGGPADDTGYGGAETPGGGGGVSVDIPLDLLSQDGVPPAAGDKVQAQIDATVNSVTGKTASLTIDAIDGQPVGQPDITDTGGPPPPGGGTSSADMKKALLAGAGANQMGIGP